MTTITSTFHQVVCDWPGCDAVDDEGEYGWWQEPEHAFEQARDAEWAVEEEPRWRLVSDPNVYPGTFSNEALSFCPKHKREHGYWLSDGPGGNLAGHDDITPLLGDAYVVRMPDGELVACS